jgi:hypothetical protein
MATMGYVSYIMIMHLFILNDYEIYHFHYRVVCGYAKVQYNSHYEITKPTFYGGYKNKSIKYEI